LLKGSGSPIEILLTALFRRPVILNLSSDMNPFDVTDSCGPFQ